MSDVGNDVGEDMVAETLGMRVFLLKNCLINRDGADISRWPRGGFDDLLAFVRHLAPSDSIKKTYRSVRTQTFGPLFCVFYLQSICFDEICPAS